LIGWKKHEFSAFLGATKDAGYDCPVYPHTSRLILSYELNKKIAFATKFEQCLRNFTEHNLLFGVTAHPDKALRLKGLFSTCGKVAVQAKIKPHDKLKVAVGGQFQIKDYLDNKDLAKSLGLGLKLKYNFWSWS